MVVFQSVVHRNIYSFAQCEYLAPGSKYLFGPEGYRKYMVYVY